MISMSKSREMFEEWYRDYYSIYLEDRPEKYSLEKYDQYPFQYIQDVPHHDWQVWRNCHREVMSTIIQSPGIGSGEEVKLLS